MLGCLDICMDSVSGKFSNDQVTAMLESKTSQINEISNHLKAFKFFNPNVKLSYY